jgi:endonuclease YncB( thermonuclease family)
MSAGAAYAGSVLRPGLLLLSLACFLAVAAASAGARPAAPLQTVAQVVDGDTIRLVSGQRVRLVQIDSPELGEGECYAHEARAALSRVLPAGTRVRLETDLRLDAVDRYGRSLAYVFKGRENVNHMLVSRGAASVWFYGAERGRYANQLDAAARNAKANRRGLWGACPATVYDPSHGVQTRRAAAPKPQPIAGKCHPSYQGACLDPSLSDYDCAGGSGNGPGYVEGPIRVVGPDEYRLDADGDGVACE